MKTPNQGLTPEQDGRRLRGDLKRQRLIAATLHIIEHLGVSGVTHRSVAKQAGLSASAATYYFATIDDLLLGALTTAANEYAVQLATLMTNGLDEIEGIAQMIANASGIGRQRALAERELTLLAARRPALRPIAQHWRILLARAASKHSKDPLTIQSMVATADGICTRILLEDKPITQTEVYDLLRHLLRQ